MNTQTPPISPKAKEQPGSCCSPLDSEEQSAQADTTSGKNAKGQSGSCCAPLDGEEQPAHAETVPVKAPEKAGLCCAPLDGEE